MRKLRRLIKNAVEERTKKSMQITSKWDPYGKGITYSFISKWLGCRERARIAYVEGWRPKGFNVSLEFGNMFHEMKDIKYSNYSKIDSSAKAESFIQRYIDNKIKRVDASASEINDLNYLQALVKITFKEYCKYWGDVSWDYEGKYTDKDTQWTDMEKVFHEPYSLPSGKIITLTGKRDGDFVHPDLMGGNMIVETKTKARFDEGELTAMLHRDLQTQMYLLSSFLQKKEMPRGVLYNVIRVTSLKPRKAESASDFAQRVGTDIRSRPDFYFKRWETRITEDDLYEFRRDTLDPILESIVDWWESIKKNPFDPWKLENGKRNKLHWIRPFGMYAGGGRDLANEYANLIERGDYTQYEQLETCFPELN